MGVSDTGATETGNTVTGTTLEVSTSFSKTMEPAALTSTSFARTSGEPVVPVYGTVIFANSTADFWTAAHLASDSTFTATITAGP